MTLPNRLDAEKTTIATTASRQLKAPGEHAVFDVSAPPGLPAVAIMPSPPSKPDPWGLPGALDYLADDLGLHVDRLDAQRFRIRDVDTLDPDTKAVALAYAESYKALILKDLDPCWGLPAECPLLDKPVPQWCRFDAQAFHRLVSEGGLYLGGPCPQRLRCGVP